MLAPLPRLPVHGRLAGRISRGRGANAHEGHTDLGDETRPGSGRSFRWGADVDRGVGQEPAPCCIMLGDRGIVPSRWKRPCWIQCRRAPTG